MVPRTSLRHLQKIIINKHNRTHIYRTEGPMIPVSPVVDVEEPVQQRVDVGNL